MIDTSMMWPHQLESYEFGKDLLSFVNGSDPGVGKTLAHAKIIEKHLSEGGSRALIVCPKTLMRSAWQEEFTKYLPGIDVVLAEAPNANRLKAFNSNSDVVVINIDGLNWLADQSSRWLANKLGQKAIMVCDESHTLKNPQAKRTKAAMKVAPFFAKKHVMSGTMTPNSVVELWSQLKIVDNGARLGKRYTAFRNLMQAPIIKGRFTEWVDRPDAQEVAYGLIKDIVIRHKFEDVMKHVPDMEQRIIYYDLPSKHMDIYQELERNSYIEHGGKQISAVNAAVLANKLLQCASGAVYNDHGGWSTIDSGRYELIADLVDGREHSLVCFLWRHQKEELIKQFNKRKFSYAILDGSVKSGAVRQEIITKYQDGEYKCLLLHPETGNFGLTLTKATSMIYASPVYEASRKLQGDARIRRGVQDKVTESIVIVARNTRDEVAYQVFCGKRDRLEALNNLFEGRKN